MKTVRQQYGEQLIKVALLFVSLIVTPCMAQNAMQGDDLDPFSIPCGQVIPNLRADSCRDDRPSCQSNMQQSTVTLPDGANLAPSGQTDVSPLRAFSDFKWNGGGAAFASLSTQCSRAIQGQRTHALTTINLLETVYAQNATNHDSCGSGFGPGGAASSNPVWHTDFTLPGGNVVKWDLTLIPSLTSQFAARSCIVSIDGVRSSVTAPGSKGLGNYAAVISGGKHTVTAQCSSVIHHPPEPDNGFPIVDVQGGCYSNRTETESFTLTIAANIHM